MVASYLGYKPRARSADENKLTQEAEAQMFAELQASTQAATVNLDGSIAADGTRRVDLSKFGENPWQQITK